MEKELRRSASNTHLVLKLTIVATAVVSAIALTVLYVQLLQKVYTLQAKVGEFEQLQARVEQKFGEVESELGDHKQKFGDHDQKFGDHDQKFGDHDQKFGDHDQKFGDHDQKFGDQERLLTNVKQQQAEHKDLIGAHRQFIENLKLVSNCMESGAG